MYRPDSDPDVPVRYGDIRRDDRNLPPAEAQRLMGRARAVRDVELAARRWAKAFDEYDAVVRRSVRTDWPAVSRAAIDYGAAQAALRDAVEKLERS